MHASIAFTLLQGLSLALALPQGTGNDGRDGFGGTFGGNIITNQSAASMDMDSLLNGSSEPGSGMMHPVNDKSGGSGPYKAWYTTDSSLPNHTIYAPRTVDPNLKLPLIAWGNGACTANGALFSNFLTEIASHGFMVIASGSPSAEYDKLNLDATALIGSFSGPTTKASWLTESIDWATGGAAGGKFGVVDATKIATAGQSCGGLEAYSAGANDTRVKLINMFNSGIVDPAKKGLLKDIKVPVGYMLGGPKDGAYFNGGSDYPLLPEGIPSVLLSLDTGHMGTYFDTQGGKFGKAAVAYYKWQFQGDEASKKWFLDVETSPLVKDGWNVTSKNWD